MIKYNINQDRILGALILLLFVGLYAVNPSFLERMERSLYDAAAKLAPTKEYGSERIAIIEIDEKSLARLGPWPWPRDLIAEMINILNQSGVKLIGVNIPLMERERNPGIAQLKALQTRLTASPFHGTPGELIDKAIKNLKELERELDNDHKLFESILRNGNVVLPVYGPFGILEKEGERDEKRSLLSENFLTSHEAHDPSVQGFSADHLSIPLTEFSRAALGLGYGNVDFSKTMAKRSLPLFIRYEGSLFPSFPLRLAIAFLNEQPKQVIVKRDEIRLKNLSIPLSKGEMLISFNIPTEALPRFSFVDLYQSKTLPFTSKDKIVLINIPLSTHPGMSEGTLIATILENILDKNFLWRPPSLPYVEMTIMLLMGGTTLFLFSKKGHTRRIFWLTSLLCLSMGSGIFLFYVAGLWFRAVYIAGPVLSIYLVLSFRHRFFTQSVPMDSMEKNRVLGLSLQGQGLLDLAFENFKKLPLNNDTKTLVYNLGLQYEKNHMIDKALAAYSYIYNNEGFRDLDDRILKMKMVNRPFPKANRTAPKKTRLQTPSPEIPARIGPYDILGELGKGPVGWVYKAVDRKEDRFLAIKTIRFSDNYDADMIEEAKGLLFKEVKEVIEITHPFIARIYDIGENGDLTYISMDLLEGKDLENYISKSTLLPLKKVLEVVACTAEALDFAHGKNLIHRAIKPSNIMLLRNGEVKVMDFGTGKALSASRRKTGVIPGNPLYMSPEQIMGQKSDPRSDIFSLGILFYQLLTGESPFKGDDLRALLYAIAKIPHPPVKDLNPRIPMACQQIIDIAMAKDPNKRFQKAGKMARYIRLLASKIMQMEKRLFMKNTFN